MHILVLADTHARYWGDIPPGIRTAVAEAELVVHCGDYTHHEIVEGLRRQAKRFIGVYGNMDGAAIRKELPKQVIFEAEGKRIAVTHPSWGGPPFPLEELTTAFPQVNIILFGHLHETVNATVDNILFINPGQGYPSYNVPASFAILSLQGAEVKGEIIFI